MSAAASPLRNLFRVGGYDPEILSNSLHFELNGWETFCIEPIPFNVEQFKKRNRNVSEYAASDVNKKGVKF